MEITGMFEAFQARAASSLMYATEEELRKTISKLTSFYDELAENELLAEIPRLWRHLKAAKIDLQEAKVEWDFVELLPNLSLSLRLFLTICVSVASCERSFSKLKLIINYLRSTMAQSRLSDLALLSIESDFAKAIDVDEVIGSFAAVKSRKGKF